MKYTSNLFLTVAFCAAGALFAGCASTKAADHVLNGMIYDYENEPVSGVTIAVSGKEQAVSDIYGHFSVDGMAFKESYDVSCAKEGYKMEQVSFTYTNDSQLVYVRMYSAVELISAAEQQMKSEKYEAALSFLTEASTAGAGALRITYLTSIIRYKQKSYQEALNPLLALTEAGCREPYVYLLIADIYQYGLLDGEQAKHFLALFLEQTYDPAVASRLSAL